jgi:hypothetical protein
VAAAVGREVDYACAPVRGLEGRLDLASAVKLAHVGPAGWPTEDFAGAVLQLGKNGPDARL